MIIVNEAKNRETFNPQAEPKSTIQGPVTMEANMYTRFMNDLNFKSDANEIL